VVSSLKTSPVRSLSGVVNISVLTKPFPCPGKCIFCPLQKDAPKSYMKDEPAVMRAMLAKYDAKRQMEIRMKALLMTGHSTDKIELRIVGGTWSYYPKEYKEDFIKKCFDACNEEKSSTLKEAQKKNEKAKHRIVCLSIETRPDFVTKEEIKEMRKMGVTMVELGVQSLFDEVLHASSRGHTVKDSAKATKLLKNAGFKVCHQVMLGLPKSTSLKDLKTFEKLFKSPSFRPDMLKIYPCVVLREAPLYELYKEGSYTPPSDEELFDTIKKVKRDIVPSYVRIQRLFRDISSKSIAGGSKISNMRQVIKRDAEKEGWECQCIRCREIKSSPVKEKLKIRTRKYKASGGVEVFFSVTSGKKICAFLRLRLKKRKTAIIRELRTYGKQVAIKKKERDAQQHKGVGKALVKKAEEEVGSGRMAVISGVGARDYWRKMGYRLKGTYMIKDL